MPYPLAVLKQFFTNNEITRGKAYFESGRVFNVKSTPDSYGIEIQASVVGSGSKPYRQDIAVYQGVDHSSWDEFEVEGECSCPIGYNCKHIAAVLFASDNLLTKGKSSYQAKPNDQSFDHWLSKTIETNRPIPKVPDNANNQLLVYELHKSDLNQRENQLNVQVYKTRKLKSGELTTANPTRVQLGNISGSERYISPVDNEVISALQVCMRDQINRVGFLYDGIRMSGRVGAMALQQLLETDRFYLGDYRQRQLLSPAPLQTAQMQWVIDSSGCQSMQLVADNVVSDIFNVHPLMGLDINSLTVFPIDTALTSAKIFQLLQAPVLEPEQSLAISDDQKQALTELNIPAPQGIRTEDIDIISIQPQLRLGLAKNPSGKICKGGYSMALSVLYNELKPVEIPADEEVISYSQDGVLYRCNRDIDKEQEFLDYLINTFDIVDLSTFFLGVIPKPGYYGFENSADWFSFMEDGIEELQDHGWSVITHEDFDLSFTDIDQWHAEIDYGEDNGWFDLSLGIEVDGQQIQLLPILLESFKGKQFSEALTSLQADPSGKKPVALAPGQYILLPNERLIPLLETFVELFDIDTNLTDGKLTLSKAQELRLLPFSNDSWKVKGAEELEKLAKQIANFSGISAVTIPNSFTGSLRDYQQQGVNWLQFLRQFHLSGILSDDMGLGKTVQALAHLAVEKQKGRMICPTLIIAPTSLMSNWRNETAKFAPNLSLLVLHGSERHDQFSLIKKHDIILTSYALVVRDEEILSKYQYHYLILDESQKIKNHKTKAANTIQNINASHRLCLTGTPMENHLGELWSQFNFLMPGFLGHEKYFNQHYRKPIEKMLDNERRAALQKRIAPVLLRRTKELVASELPKKTEIVKTISLSGTQRDLYETIRLMMDKKVRKEIANKGMSRSHIMILDALLKLRQVCCHPGLLKLKAAAGVNESAKLGVLMEMLPELVEEGRKILLFSQFTSMLAVIETNLKNLGLDYVKLTGQTKDRDTPIEKFQSGTTPIFLISLKAGGIGLNLTAADTVIHYDPWWNPAVEDQATDRAHRIGQDKPVFVYKLVTEDTVESKILAMQQRKRLLAEQTLDSHEKSAIALNDDDLKNLFGPM